MKWRVFKVILVSKEWLRCYWLSSKLPGTMAPGIDYPASDILLCFGFKKQIMF